jgi:hypothetical protein
MYFSYVVDLANDDGTVGSADNLAHQKLVLSRNPIWGRFRDFGRFCPEFRIL